MRKLVLLGQHKDEYRKMFDLSEEDLNTRIFEYPSDPSVMNKELRPLPFADFSFDFALSAYGLFTDMDAQDINIHLQVIRELARIAKEVRIFPLIDSHGEPFPLLGPVLLGLQQEQYGVEVREVNYSLQPKGNAMLRVWAQQCQLA